MKILLSIMLVGAALAAPGTVAAEEAPASPIKGYYTRLPFDDHGYTGKYADIVVELPQRGQFIFSREFGYQGFLQFGRAYSATSHHEVTTAKSLMLPLERMVCLRSDDPPEKVPAVHY